MITVEHQLVVLTILAVYMYEWNFYVILHDLNMVCI